MPQFWGTQKVFLKPPSAANNGYQCMTPLRRIPEQNSMPQTTRSTGCVTIFLKTCMTGRRFPSWDRASSPVSKSLKPASPGESQR